MFKTEPKFKIGTARRFEQPFIFHRNTKSMQSLSICKAYKNHVRGGAFSKAIRFRSIDLSSKDLKPGPGAYDIHDAHNSIVLAKSFSRDKERFLHTNNPNPGPAEYNPKFYIKKSPIVLPQVIFKKKIGKTNTI